MNHTQLSHSVPSGPPVPEMVQAVLTFDDLSALVADLESLAIIRNVAGKGDARRYASSTPLTLMAGIDQLRQGELPALQIVYQFDGHTWTDTLFRLTDGVRMVRCQHVLPH